MTFKGRNPATAVLIVSDIRLKAKHTRSASNTHHAKKQIRQWRYADHYRLWIQLVNATQWTPLAQGVQT
jgi:hypothetical protein